MPSCEIVTMVYKSTAYLDFIVDQCQRHASEFPLRVIANDATDEVIDRLLESDVPWNEYKDPEPDAHYLCRVYRAWNFGVSSSPHDYVCLMNSDMALSEGAIQTLYDRQLAGGGLFTSRLVESGKMPSGLYGISKDFGRHPSSFQEDAWLEYARSIRKTVAAPGGLYMPVIWHRDSFLGYPEGNVGKISGDKYLFDRVGTDHLTAFDSVVYHIQEGEMDE